jgi:hypothetical protein
MSCFTESREATALLENDVTFTKLKALSIVTFSLWVNLKSIIDSDSSDSSTGIADSDSPKSMNRAVDSDSEA